MTPDLDIAGMSNRLRASTAKLLGLHESKLSVAEKIRVDRASALRLLLDDMQAAQLNGGAIDVGEFIKASEELERLAGGNPETTSTHDFAGAREELARFFAQRAERIEAREVKESERLREENERLLAEVAELQAKLKAQPAPSPPPAPANNVVPLDAARAEERARDERAWRNYTYGGGALIAPAWSPPEHRR
jgi:hypothetical protein